MKRFIAVAVAILPVMGIVAAYLATPLAMVGAGLAAKTVCSQVFLADRSVDDVLAEELGPYWYVGAEVNRERRSVTGHVMRAWQRLAIYRPGFGCTLVPGLDLDAATPVPDLSGWQAATTQAVEWPAPATGGDYGQLDRAIDLAFSEHPNGLPTRTRAVIVVQHGQVLAERYAPGIDAGQRQRGWSMSKSVLGTLVGMRVRDGKLSPDQPVVHGGWAADDPRTGITVRDLIQMSSGLEFDETYGANGDPARLLYGTPDAAGFAAGKPLVHTPGSKWLYSSGTSNLLAWVLRRSFESDDDYWRYPYERLFAPAGMTSAVFEVDASGTFIGSSWMFATPRDWTRLGLLYLDNGMAGGQQIIDPDWVRFSVAAAPAAPDGKYGAHWWTNDGQRNGLPGMYPKLPEDAYFAIGYEGQIVAVFPARNLVVTRMGLSHKDAWNNERFLANVLDALELDQSAAKDGGE